MMRSLIRAVTFALSLPLVVCQTADEIEAYPWMHLAMSKYGYVWESHKAQTEDGWILTLFRVYGKLHEDGETVSIPHFEPEHADKDPILAMHGAGGNAVAWIGADPGEPNLLLRLVDRGYDVWVGGSRGSLYSNENIKDGTWSDEERWSHTWTDMGYYDLPADIDKILEVTGKSKVTLMGYSQGTS